MSPAEISEKLKSFKGLILDGDGVWFTGEEYRAVLPDGQPIVMKSRHHHDGQGVSYMRALGVKVLFATGEGEPMKSVVEKLNNLRSAKDGTFTPVSVLTDLNRQHDKVGAVEEWLKEEQLSWDECAYIGDDRTDWEAMQKAGLKAAPGNAQPFIQKIADIVLTKEGGKGAVREFVDMALDARGIDQTTLPAA